MNAVIDLDIPKMAIATGMVAIAITLDKQRCSQSAGFPAVAEDDGIGVKKRCAVYFRTVALLPCAFTARLSWCAKRPTNPTHQRP